MSSGNFGEKLSRDTFQQGTPKPIANISIKALNKQE